MKKTSKVMLLASVLGVAACERVQDAPTSPFPPPATTGISGSTAGATGGSGDVLGVSTGTPFTTGSTATAPTPGPATTAGAPGSTNGALSMLDSGLVDAASPGVVDPAPQKCAPGATLSAGDEMEVSLGSRKYVLHVGTSVDVDVAAPLLFSLHGLNMTPRSMESMARWHPVADREGFIVASPAGVGGSNGWNLSGSEDFDLMKEIIEDVASKLCVDRKRIYATGFSHGGFMSNAIGCRLADVFAAVAPHSGAGGGACSAARPIPVYAFHGDGDFIVSYSSGESTVNGWVSRNQCSSTPTSYSVGSAQCEAWSECDAGADVKFCTIPGGGHSWFRGATDAIWEFFTEHPLP